MWILADGAGRLIAWAQTEGGLPPVRPSSVVRELPAWSEPPGPPYVYDAASLNWVVNTKASQVMTPSAFQWRYTLAEQVAIERAMVEHPDPDVRATLRVYDKSLMRGGNANLSDPRTIAAVQYHASLDLIQSARVAEILGTA